MLFNIRVIEAEDIPISDPDSDSNTYAVVTFGRVQNSQKTNSSRNSRRPSWNKDLQFVMPQYEDIMVQVVLYNADNFTKDKPISNLVLIITDYEFGEIIDKWFGMKPFSGLDKGGRIHLMFQMCPKDHPPFSIYSGPKPQNAKKSALPPLNKGGIFSKAKKIISDSSNSNETNVPNDNRPVNNVQHISSPHNPTIPVQNNNNNNNFAQQTQYMQQMGPSSLPYPSQAPVYPNPPQYPQIPNPQYMQPQPVQQFNPPYQQPYPPQYPPQYPNVPSNINSLPPPKMNFGNQLPQLSPPMYPQPMQPYAPPQYNSQPHRPPPQQPNYYNPIAGAIPRVNPQFQSFPQPQYPPYNAPYPPQYPNQINSQPPPQMVHLPPMKPQKPNPNLYMNPMVGAVPRGY